MKSEQKTLHYKGQIVFEKLTMPHFERIPKEFFQNEACFIFVNEGEFSVRSPTNYLSFEKGKGLLAKCLNYYFETNEAQRANTEGVEVIGVLLYPSMVEELFQFDVTDSSHTVDYNLKEVEVDGLLEIYKESIKHMLEHPEIVDEALIRIKLKEFILLISKTESAPSQLDFLAAMFKANATEFKATIRHNLYSSLSVEEFSKLCGMSVSTFKRKFKDTFDESPKKYFARMKVEKARQMLASKKVRISEVAYDCGFESLATFNRNFKALVGKSPSDYRMSQNDQ